MSTDKEIKRKALKNTLDNLDKVHGKGAVMRMGDAPAVDVEVISTGSLTLDIALGTMGFPKGRIIEIYGPESCLSGDTFIPYAVHNAKGERINHKGGTLKHLYERFTGQRDGKPGDHLSDKNVTYTVASSDTDGAIFHNDILDVVSTGVKPLYLLTTDTGKKIKATEDHKFLTPVGFVRLGDLCMGDLVTMHNNTRETGRARASSRDTICVKNHPTWPTKVVRDPIRDYVNTYKRGQYSHLCYEAHMNQMTVEEYRKFLNSKDPDFSVVYTIPEGMHIHHLDEDFRNNSWSNLLLIHPVAHGKLHMNDKDKLRNLSYVTANEIVYSIEYIGEEETYDIKCPSPHNNYVADQFVVHNSGKTTLAIHAMAECQKVGGTVAFIDAEHAFDRYYAKNLGVDTDNLIISQPDNGEQALEITENLIRSGGIDLIVIDSVAALVPRAEIEGEMGDNKVGLHARLMSQAMRKLTGAIHKTNCCCIFINQLREKIGVMFGSPEVTTGGNALKFYASQRLDIRKSGQSEKDKDGVVLANHVKVKVIKNKLAPPFTIAEFDIEFGTGISKAGEIVDLGVNHNIIEKSGSWYSYEGSKIAQGRPASKQFMLDNPEVAAEIEQKIKDIIKPKS